MPFTPAVKNPGDLARSQEWNETLAEVVRLDNAKVNKTGDTITGPLMVGNLRLGNWPANPNNYVFFGTTALDQTSAGNYALLQDSAGSDAGRTFLNSPVDIRFRINNGNRMILANNGHIGIGLTEPQARLHIAHQSDVTLTGGGALIIGDVNGNNIAMDNNEILARNNGQTADLHLQADGGALRIHNNRSTAERVMVTDAGNVGLGTTSPNFKLDVRGTIGNNNTQHHSDLRWKKNISPLADALSKVMQLRGVAFEWRTAEYLEMNFPQGQQVGLIAQEVEEVIPAVVSTAEDGYKSIAYANLVAVLIEAVKELQTEVMQLKTALGTVQAAPANGRQMVLSTE